MSVNFRFAKVEINVSPPIIPFRETIIPRPKVDMVNEVIDDVNHIRRKTFNVDIDQEGIQIFKNGLLEIKTSNKACTFHIRAVPLPEPVTTLLEENAELIRILDQHVSAMLSGKPGDLLNIAPLAQTTLISLKELKSKLEEAFSEAGKKWRGCVERIWAFGPRRCGPNLLVNRIDDYPRVSLWSWLDVEGQGSGGQELAGLKDLDHSVVSGFQLATLAGPICEEPMMGVCFLIEKWEMEATIVKAYRTDNKSNGRAQGVKSPIELEENTNKERTSLAGDNSIPKESRSSAILIPNNASHRTTSATHIGVMPLTPSSLILDSFPVGSPQSPCTPVPPMTFSGVYGPLSGQVISTVKEGCRLSFHTQPQRLRAAMYKCDIQATAEVLGESFLTLSVS